MDSDDDVEYPSPDNLSDVVAALSEVESAVKGVRRAIESKSSFWSGLVFLFIAVIVWGWVSDLWNSKWRYATAYSVSTGDVYIPKRPHDCEFMTAPVGEKHCSYKRTVSTIRWATSTANAPIMSTDEGKTWETFIPDSGVQVPQHSTVKEVYVNWEKEED
jgi:hypothetical protein